MERTDIKMEIRKYMVSIPFFLFGIYAFTWINKHWAFALPGLAAFMFGIQNYSESKTMEDNRLI